MMRKNSLRSLLMLLSLVLGAGNVLAQVAVEGTETRVQQGDVLQLKVSGHPQFDLNLVVGSGGRVDVPQIGEVRVGGLTVAEAEVVIRQSLRVFDPTIGDISLGLARTEGFQVHVLGAVVQPGPYTFVAEPSLWDLVRTAGGPQENAHLRAARLVREVEGKVSVQPVDLEAVLAGESGGAYEIRSGDTLMIPVLPEDGSGLLSDAGVQVFGSVDAPKFVDITEATPLLEVLLMAGSPSDNAKIEEIWWVHREGAGLRSTRVNLEDFLKRSNPRGNPLVYPGDAVHVAYQKPGWLERNLPLFLGVVATTATVLLAYDRLSDE